MKSLIIILVGLTTFVCQSLFAQTVDKVEPHFWWSGMKNPELQIMLYGKNISDFRPSIDYPGIILKNTVMVTSPNYLILYLDVSKAQPGKFNITLTRERRKIAVPYELKARKESTDDIQGFDSSDVLYLIMPDRFANGDPSNDNIPMRKDYQVDRNARGARHGGDLAGIEQHLDYIKDLGVTAIWLNPVVENDMTGGSYHGYASTDFYRVDPRIGTNEDYRRLIEKAHQKGLRVVMDMIFNHCGSDHPWLSDIPSPDWFNKLDWWVLKDSTRFVQTNHAKEVYYDPYASDYDFDVLVNGWFVRTMPDLNQKNPHVAKYLMQNSIWWIEYSRIDGIRQDTYPYPDYDVMVEWCKEVMNEYPQYNIVGESWINNTIGTAFWQKDSKVNFGKNTELKSTMDFTLMGNASDIFHDQSPNGRLSRLYQHLCYDYVYPDVNNVLRFLENHDTRRFLPEMPEDLSAYKQGLAFLLTIPGTPQLYYGMEFLMYGSNNRQDVPGGWPDDNVNYFTAAGRSPIQNEAWNYMQTLLKWRQGNEIISKGKMKHFQVNQGVYVYERSYNGKSVLVIMNGASREVNLPLNRYAEVIRGKTSGKDVITKRTVALGQEIKLVPKEVLILEM